MKKIFFFIIILVLCKTNICASGKHYHGPVSLNCKDMNLREFPDAIFLSEDIAVCPNISIVFNAPENPAETSYHWIVSQEDGTILHESEEETISFIFEKQIRYNVSLRAYLEQDGQVLENEHSIEVIVLDTPDAIIRLMNIVENDSIDNAVKYGHIAILSGSTNVESGTTNYSFEWEPAELLEDPHAAITQTKYPMVEPQIFTLSVTNINNGCTNTTQDTVNVIGDKLIITDTICNDGASYVDGKYRYILNEDDSIVLDFPGHYTDTIDSLLGLESESNIVVYYNITLLDEFKVSEIGNGSNAEVVHYLGTGHDFFEFSIDNVSGGGTDENIEGFDNINETYEWSIQMIDETTPWTLSQDDSNTVIVNVKSEGAAYLECMVSSACSVEKRWILLFTPGNRPCDVATNLNVNSVSGTWANINWQSPSEKCIVQYSTDENFLSIEEEINTTCKNIILDGLENNTTYYWRVSSACDENLEFIVGDSFTTQKEGVGIDESFTDDEIVLYPNPARDYVIIEGDGISAIEIYEYTGILVYRNISITDRSTKINTSDMNHNLHIVRITCQDGQSRSLKLLVK